MEFFLIFYNIYPQIMGKKLIKNYKNNKDKKIRKKSLNKNLSTIILNLSSSVQKES